MGDAEPFRLGVYPTQTLAIRNTPEPESDVLNDGQMGKEGELLKDIADTPFANREIDTLRAVEEDLIAKSDEPAIGPDEAGYGVENSTLARARRAEKYCHPGCIEGSLDPEIVVSGRSQTLTDIYREHCVEGDLFHPVGGV